MTNTSLISSFWNQVSALDADIRLSNASTLCNLYDCEVTLGLDPLPEISSGIPDIRILTKSPAFKNLDIPGIQSLRKLVETESNMDQVKEWAETLMRFMEIFRTTLEKRAREKFETHGSARTAMLEITAFMMDCYYAWDDLRFLNIAMKLMDIRWIYSIESIDILIADNHQSLKINLLQVRLMIMKKAAIQNLLGNIHIV